MLLGATAGRCAADCADGKPRSARFWAIPTQLYDAETGGCSRDLIGNLSRYAPVRSTPSWLTSLVCSRTPTRGDRSD